MLTVRAEAMNSLDALDARDAEVANLKDLGQMVASTFQQLTKERDTLQTQLAELIRDRKLFKEALEEQVSGQSDWATEYCAVIIERERNEALQAQVAKAREALELIQNKSPRCDCMDAPGIASEALAELEKDVGLHDRTSKLQIQQVDALRAQKEKAKETLKKCLHARQCNAPWGQTEKYPSVEEFKRVLSELEEA